MPQDTLATPVLRASGSAFQNQMNGLLKTRFQLSSYGTRTYDGEIQKSYVSDRLRLADIRFTPHHTRPKAGKASSKAGHSFLVSQQVEGHSVVKQDGRRAEIGPNQIFFIDTSQPFEIETDEIRTRSIYLDSHFWREIFPERSMFTATALDCHSGMGRTCASMIDDVFALPWSRDDQMMHRLAGCLANLLAVSMVNAHPDQPALLAARSSTLNRILDVIHQNLADPDLDCPRIAAEVGLSVRQVHSVFGGTGTTVMRYIWQKRLEKIAAELENHALAHKPVSAIAFEWGFNESAHFSRQFKAQFGVPPAKYRATSQGSAAGRPQVALKGDQPA